MSQATIQTHVDRIQQAFLDAEADVHTLPPEIQDEANRALKFAHKAAELSFKAFKALTGGQTDGVELRSGPVEK